MTRSADTAPARAVPPPAASTPAVPPEDEALLALARAVRDTGYRFITPTPATHERVNRRPGNRWARGLADVFGWSRPFKDGVLPGAMLDLLAAAGELERAGEGWRSRVRLSSLGGELFWHSAYPTVEADSVFFGPDTYRFAGALEAWLDRGGPVRRAVDIGAGAGPGGIVVAKARPGAEVVLADINPAALRLARVNARLAGTPGVDARRSDLLSGVEGAFDLIICNPPYLNDGAERAYRHGGGPLGAGLSLATVEAACERLASGGTLLLYTGVAIVDGEDPFREAAAARLDGAGLRWTYRELDPDVFGEELDTEAYGRADRIAAVVLTAIKQR